MNKEDLQQIVAIRNKSQEFTNLIKKAIFSFSSSIFNDAYDDFENFLSKPKFKLEEKDVAVKIAVELSDALCNLFKIKAFKEEQSLEYLGVISDKVSPKLFAFILWTQDKKQACLKILENHEVELSRKEYDSLIFILLPHKLNSNVPYDRPKRTEYLSKQKKEFYYYHDKYKLAHELASLPSENKETNKKLKI